MKTSSTTNLSSKITDQETQTTPTPSMMVHKSIKSDFPDLIQINTSEEIPYYSFILGDSYDLYSSPNQNILTHKKKLIGKKKVANYMRFSTKFLLYTSILLS